MASTARFYLKNASRRTPSPLSTRRATVACNICPRDVCLSTISRDTQAATKEEAHNHGTAMPVAAVQNTAIMSPSTASIHGVTTAAVSVRHSCSESTSSSRRSRELSARVKLAAAELKLARIQLELAECESEDSTEEDSEENNYNDCAPLQKIREPYEAQRCQIRLPVEEISNECTSLRYITYETLDQRCDVYLPEENIINDCTSIQEIQRCPQILSEDLAVVSNESCCASSVVTSRAHSPTDFEQEDRPRSEFTTSGVKAITCEVMNRGTNYALREATQQWKSCDENKRNKTSIKKKSSCINIEKIMALVKTPHKRLTDERSERLIIRNKNGVMLNSSDEHSTSYNSRKKIKKKRTKQMKTAFDRKDDKISSLPRRSSHDSQHSSRWKWNWRMKQRLGTPPENKCISGSTQATSRRVQGDVKRANENIPRKLSWWNNIPKCKRMRRLMRDMGYFNHSTQYATVLQIAYINTGRRRIIDVNRKGGVLRKTSLKKLLVPTASPN